MLVTATGLRVTATIFVIVVIALLDDGVVIIHATSMLWFMLPRLRAMANAISFPWAIAVRVTIIEYDHFVAMPVERAEEVVEGDVDPR